MFEVPLANIWKETLNFLRENTSKPTFDTWFQGSELVGYYGDILVIQTPNDITKSFLKNNYYDMIKSHLEDALNHPVKITIVTPREQQQTVNSLFEEKGYDMTEAIAETPQVAEHQPAFQFEDSPMETPVQVELNFSNCGLNPKYTFDTFVIGNSNKFAHAACEAVAKNIAKSLDDKKIYNPLFIYGGPGLGKTHLMQAIAHYILSHNPSAKIMYVSSEKFTNELIDGIQNNTTYAFRNKYRNVDVLLIDDIQFLKKKEGTQEEFFHTFNDLHEANKQIIISSDRQPKEIPTLEDRLRTRFEWGLITDIQPPDFETRVAILKKKAQLDGIEIDNDVLSYIADNIQSNIRELEGVLVRLVAFSTLNNRPINLALAQESLSNIIPSNMPVILTGELIQQKVAETYGVRVEDLNAKKRTRTFAYPRQVAMYLCREMTDLSLPKIGELFGGRDHTTVLHGCEKISQELKKDPGLQTIINNIKQQLLGSQNES